ncbi:MAG TPA: NAD-dependent 4,6-dehydratase LegB [Bacteroidia bacterium]|nr:MAG: nucleoside-diphosphate-sugar epimerase [Bacteroidetes bacterium OLB10]MCC7514607.1 SDR family NAD(P)-dependent oxidoreductase [Bacteroidia bacterium]MCE7955739.1 SDR family NAD(P)-dependent oxidoreductase [Bacteroidetes bacterium CHB6]MCO5288618.1 NAD-dependent 4,6-dehydratase LegB [Bacteroidota bacterium]HNR47956.1 NAD-dependent 4,6-dehydratase LegB [Bacteroidia bacterium]
MKNVLVTGAAGFIGSHLTERCVESGYKVKAFVRYNSKGNYGWLESSPYKNDIEFITGDIRDYDSVYNAVKGCDTVFHLAALIGIPYSYVSPMAYIKTNVEGTYNIVQSCREQGTENILVTSTSETYGTAQYVPIDEKHPLVGQSPYSASKIGADQMALSYYLSFNSPVKIVRPFNTYGPRQSARAVIPTIITQLLSGKTEIKLGHTTPTRDLTFVKDTANGFLAIAQNPAFNGTVTNIGMKDEISVGDLALMIAKLMNKNISIITDSQRVRPDKSEVERLFCDNTKIVSNTNWRPQLTLEEGLKQTIKFLESNLHLYKPDVYNV